MGIGPPCRVLQQRPNMGFGQVASNLKGISREPPAAESPDVAGSRRPAKLALDLKGRQKIAPVEPTCVQIWGSRAGFGRTLVLRCGWTWRSPEMAENKTPNTTCPKIGIRGTRRQCNTCFKCVPTHQDLRILVPKLCQTISLSLFLLVSLSLRLSVSLSLSLSL